METIPLPASTLGRDLLLKLSNLLKLPSKVEPFSRRKRAIPVCILPVRRKRSSCRYENEAHARPG
jgi:hypothetical protein